MRWIYSEVKDFARNIEKTNRRLMKRRRRLEEFYIGNITVKVAPPFGVSLT